ncbi:hypothetical protein SAMD00019534_108010 [Acytostelium subglobosum LB1]|uniref:hypothetical protein n=1 Tax=Acytostelium subglobosum LB1 TaxID=1410327 RepID=UPI000644C7FB|nr:hypothetical protein SAMD00019534_108010 [Acytostelium subglobosum LB1]GAM27625.1 hypothetical protein SAMD00019534_108010 [Acytostelium subglobosum LB1]|eukprot:XP_012749284.1 hypothetical protein SAMD00019534_108010 [Acytostelium subglobosum LB1]
METNDDKTLAISRDEASNIQQCIEKCFTLYMTKTEIIITLQNQFNVNPTFSETMLMNLERQNPDFFNIYYKRLKIKEQIIEFNHLASLQLKSMIARQGDPGAAMQQHHSSLKNGGLVDTSLNNNNINNNNNGHSNNNNNTTTTTTTTATSSTSIDDPYSLLPTFPYSAMSSTSTSSVTSVDNGSQQQEPAPLLSVSPANDVQQQQQPQSSNQGDFNNPFIKQSTSDVLSTLIANTHNSNSIAGFESSTSNNNMYQGLDNSTFGAIDISQIPLSSSFSFAFGGDDMKRTNNMLNPGGMVPGDHELGKSTFNLNMSQGGSELESFLNPNM